MCFHYTYRAYKSHILTHDPEGGTGIKGDGDIALYEVCADSEENARDELRHQHPGLFFADMQPIKVTPCNHKDPA